MIENYRDIQVDISEENKKAGAYIIIDKVLNIIERFDDTEVDEIYAYEDPNDGTDGCIEFFLDAGGNSKEYGDSTIEIAKAIKKELKLSVYLGQEDYGCLDMLQLDDNPYSQVERLKNMDENEEQRIQEIDGEIDEFIAEFSEKHGIVFNDFNALLDHIHDWEFKE